MINTLLLIFAIACVKAQGDQIDSSNIQSSHDTVEATQGQGAGLNPRTRTTAPAPAGHNNRIFPIIAIIEAVPTVYGIAKKVIEYSPTAYGYLSSAGNTAYGWLSNFGHTVSSYFSGHSDQQPLLLAPQTPFVANPIGGYVQNYDGSIQTVGAPYESVAPYMVNGAVAGAIPDYGLYNQRGLAGVASQAPESAQNPRFRPVAK